MSNEKLKPASKKQADFLKSKSDITVFGGAAKQPELVSP